MPELPPEIAALQMRLRSGGVVGGTRTALTPEQRHLFEEGLAIVFHRWTALCLAIEQQWGGTSSADKASELYLDVLEWFDKGHVQYADELEDLLAGALMADFNMHTEDGSPRQIAKELVGLHHQLSHNDLSLLSTLRAAAPSGASTSQRQHLDRDGTVLEGDDESSSDSGDEDMPDSATEMEVEAAPKAQQPERVVDDDGFELVQSRRRR